MKLRPSSIVLSCVLLASALAPLARAENAPAYLRYPDIWNGRIVFAAEGDLWSTTDRGGPSRRLTSHPGTEYFPRFSPDGKWIAFTGEYDGNRDVYVMEADGGEPRRLTWHPAFDEVLGWTPDSKKILFRSRSGNPMAWEVFTVAADGKSEPEKLPIGWVARIAIDPASGMWAFNRKSWETATWKRYRGGTAPDIWVGHPDRGDFKSVTSFTGTNAFPMWHGGRVFFLSDAGGTANIWSMKPDGSDRKRHTDFAGWDARWPSIGPDGRIVFTLGGDIQLFDPKDGSVKKVDVDLPSDRTLTRVRYPAPSQNLTAFTLSPKGDRLLVTTRGKVFSVAVKNGVTLPVTHEDGARATGASFSGDGKKVVYVSDVPREEEIRVADAWGRGEPKVVKPAGTSGWHFPPVFSPDGKWIAYGDQTQALWVMPAEGGTPKLVDKSPQSEIRRYAFSPDGRWLAYAKDLATSYTSIGLYDTKTQKTTVISGPTTSDDFPAWDPEGRYLYFLSDRATNPVLDTRDLQNVELKNNVLMAVLLRKDVKSPVANVKGLPGDEDEAKDDKKDDKDKKDGKNGKGDAKDQAKKADEPPKPVEIDLDGIASRVVQLPLDRGRYRGLWATAKQVFTLSVPLKGMAEEGDNFGGEERAPELTLLSYDLEKRKAKPFLEGVSQAALASKADKLAVMKKRGEIYVVDAGAAPPPPAEFGETKVSLDGIVVEVDPRKEWTQIYYEAWRQMRDFFWDPAMGQVDWKGVRDRYATLLPRLGTRDDLRDLIGELIGELNNSHTYVFGGDPGVNPTHVSTGLLGADVVREGRAFKVTRVYRGDPADNVRSPLDEPGANVAEGEYVVAVNHVPFAADRSFYASFENLAGKEVVLTVSGKASGEASRDVAVKTLAADGDLRYADWVRQNREYVAKKTDGKIGYLHLPDMGSNGQTRFNTWFYPQLDKEGMVVDCRWNGGGFVSQMILERFRRKVLSFDRARGGGIETYPYRTLNGPFVVLTNEFAGSDGDIFPAMVQIEGLAPVIGMRSWGGVVGIRGDKRLVDGGMVTEPEFALWQPKKGWSIENLGVVPDIEVQNLPQELGKGVDTQLDRAIAEVTKLHTLHPPVKPEFGPVRDRRREAFGEEMKLIR